MLGKSLTGQLIPYSVQLPDRPHEGQQQSFSLVIAAFFFYRQTSVTVSFVHAVDSMDVSMADMRAAQKRSQNMWFLMLGCSTGYKLFKYLIMSSRTWAKPKTQSAAEIHFSQRCLLSFRFPIMLKCSELV